MDSIYLDHAAATPLRPEVRAVLSEVSDRLTGNPSGTHAWGRQARAALEDARERTAAVLRTRRECVRFVRGGTEAINLAILGRVDWARRHEAMPGRLLRSSVEHSAVRNSVAAAGFEGAEVEVIPVQPNGDVTLPGKQELGAGRILLVSMQWVNQETGLILPIPAIAERCESAGIPLHVDAVQAAGKIPIRLDETPIDLMSLSGHKLGGPRSSGALIVTGDAEIRPRMFGGGQEGGLRPGTEDVSGAVGFALALEISASTLDEEAARLTGLRQRLEEGLGREIPGLRVHSIEGPRAPHISNFGIRGVAMDVLVGALDLEGVGVSAGSACRSGATSTSPVLRALYGPEAEQFAPMRLSLGWSTTEDEIDKAIQRIPPIIERIRGST